MNTITWGRRSIPKLGMGYEVSSKGDARFSALNAVLPDGRTIEMHYQCCVKGYQPGGTDWRLGKGKPPLDPSVDLWNEYLNLWRIWACENLPLLRELWQMATAKGDLLTDCFASTPINQAHALSQILNDLAATNGHPVWWDAMISHWKPLT
jgi:hypothetical protein